MRLLVVTQKVDKNDHILGFFHRWLEELAKNCESLLVICLAKGEYSLPGNVKVLSLGKEQGVSKAEYLYRFYRYIWSERNNYDAVFVHMNQEYIILAGTFWRLMGKKVFLWRLHPVGNKLTDIACSLSHKVFTSSKRAFVSKSNKARLIPVGVDLTRFTPAALPVESDKILVFGRIAPIKKLEVIIEGLKELETKGVEYKVDIVGDALHQDLEYYDSLRDKIRKSGLSRKVRMLPAVPHSNAPELYKRYKLLINLTPDGSLDKTIIEALSSGLKVIVSNSHFKGMLPENWVIDNPEDPVSLAHRIKMVLSDSHNRNTEAKNRISELIEEHRIEKVIGRLVDEMSDPTRHD